MGVVEWTRDCRPVPTSQVVGGGAGSGGRGREKKLSPSLTSRPTRAGCSTSDDPQEVQLPPPTSGPRAPHKLRDYSSRQALRSRGCGFIDLALQGLMGVEVLSASPGCRDGNLGGGVRYEMPGSQGAAGERNDVWDLENPRSPISLGAMEWINIPMPGGGWARSGYTQVFRDPPLPGPRAPPPGRPASSAALLLLGGRSAHLCTYLRPHAPGPPPRMGLGQGLWQGEGEERTHPELPPPPPQQQPR